MASDTCLMLLCFMAGVVSSAAVIKIRSRLVDFRRDLDQLREDVDALGKRHTNNTDAAFLDIVANTLSGKTEIEIIEGHIYTLVNRLEDLRNAINRISEISGQARSGPFSYHKESINSESKS